MIVSPRNPTLDWMRGLSALAVFSGHLRAAMFIDFTPFAETRLLHKAFYLLTSLGHQGVIVFFVLSGYLVGGSVIRSFRATSTLNIKKYLISRMTRLWIVLIPALVFTLITDSILEVISPETLHGFYRSIWNSGPELGTYSVGAKTFICNLFFLQTIASPVYGTNAPLWSLANEFWYYLMFPPLAFCLSNKTEYMKRVVGLIIFLMFVFVLPASIMSYFAIWLIGAFVSYVFIYFQSRMTGAYCAISFVISIFFLGVIIVASKLSLINLDQFTYDILISVSSATLILLSSAALKVTPVGTIKNRHCISLALSETSYTLYLFHFPAIVLIASIFFRHQLSFNFSGLLIYLVILFFIWAFCACVWYIFERNTSRLKSQCEKFIM